MRGTLLFVLVLLLFPVVICVNYYFDAANGNDEQNNGSEQAPFKSINKIANVSLIE
jgi:hypothetical protein